MNIQNKIKSKIDATDYSLDYLAEQQQRKEAAIDNWVELGKSIKIKTSLKQILKDIAHGRA